MQLDAVLDSARQLGQLSSGRQSDTPNERRRRVNSHLAPRIQLPGTVRSARCVVIGLELIRTDWVRVSAVI